MKNLAPVVLVVAALVALAASSLLAPAGQSPRSPSPIAPVVSVAPVVPVGSGALAAARSAASGASLAAFRGASPGPVVGASPASAVPVDPTQDFGRRFLDGQIEAILRGDEDGWAHLEPLERFAASPRWNPDRIEVGAAALEEIRAVLQPLEANLAAACLCTELAMLQSLQAAGDRGECITLPAERVDSEYLDGIRAEWQGAADEFNLHVVPGPSAGIQRVIILTRSGAPDYFAALAVQRGLEAQRGGFFRDYVRTLSSNPR